MVVVVWAFMRAPGLGRLLFRIIEMEPEGELAKLVSEELISFEREVLHLSGDVSVMTTGSFLAAVGGLTEGSLNEYRG